MEALMDFERLNAIKFFSSIIEEKKNAINVVPVNDPLFNSLQKEIELYQNKIESLMNNACPIIDLEKSKTKKRSIEVNGPANITMMLGVIKMMGLSQQTADGETVYLIDEKTFNAILKECDKTITYMKKYVQAVNNNEETPFWHEINN
jgi:hypothetical protein